MSIGTPWFFKNFFQEHKLLQIFGFGYLVFWSCSFSAEFFPTVMKVSSFSRKRFSEIVFQWYVNNLIS